MEKPIDKLIDEIEEYIKNVDMHFIKSLEAVYKKLIYNVHTDVVRQYNKGYCMRIMVPEREVLASLNSVPTLSNLKITEAFTTQWIVPKNAHMHNSTYYHILLLVHLIATKHNNNELAKSSLSLLLFRIWNGRIIGAIKFCDPDTMQYVTSVMMNNKFKAKLYPSPFEMITDYFTPTIHAFYTKNVLSDSTETKRLFEQCYARIKQVFRSNPMTNLKTGEKKYATGLQPYYYKCKEMGLKISTIKTSKNSDDYESSDSFNSSAYEDQINDVTVYIVMNDSPKYEDNFINFLVGEIRGLNKVSTVKLLNCIHHLQYHDIVQDLLQNLFRRFGSITQANMCGDDFYKEFIQKRIISSKHTQDVINIKELADSLLTDIFDTKYEKKFSYSTVSDTQKSVYRKIIIYGLAYNIRRRLCN
jgi:hypothetical protein